MNEHWIFKLKKEKLLKLLMIGNELAPRVSDLLIGQLQIGISDDSIHANKVMEEIHSP